MVVDLTPENCEDIAEALNFQLKFLEDFGEETQEQRWRLEKVRNRILSYEKIYGNGASFVPETPENVSKRDWKTRH